MAVINTTANYTVKLADKGGLIVVNSSTARTITLPSSLPVDFDIAIFQEGTAQAMLAVQGGGLRHPDGHTRTAKRYATVYAKVFRNPGSAPLALFTGETGP